ncbi:hypothetical protein GKE82_00700 [Conexibacter sp. W3-3-2]|uniref:hypothetical protein n=1 Tax=Conexibacter sp. W3-3-2 TaxID=2675227 RepID=UPI0012B7F02D|nr:hypothetical protein [Conexibacter sp. W3-3-2]MTD42859.1 hypothetical protein [Conexibacter sp. W3-3-2]
MTPTRADRLSTPLVALDAPANAISDVLNDAIPWLWWPLRVPARDAPLTAPAHALYAVHGTVALLAARRLSGRALPTGPSLALGLLSWLWFTGAWDRRARRLAARAR